MLDSGGIGVFKRGLTFKEMAADALLQPFQLFPSPSSINII